MPSPEHTVQELIEQTAFTLAHSVYCYAYSIPYIGNRLTRLATEQSEPQRIYFLQSRVGAMSIIAGEMSRGRAHESRAIISTVGSLSYMRHILSKFPGKGQRLSFSIAAIDFDVEMNPQTNYVPALEFARENNIGLVISTTVEESLHMSVFVMLSALCRPTVHVYDGLLLAKMQSDGLSHETAYSAYKSVVEDLPIYTSKPREDIQKTIWERINVAFGKNYAPFEYYGSPLASRVVFVFGSEECTVAREFIDSLGTNRSLGLINVRVFRPFDEIMLLEAIPSTSKDIYILGQVSRAEEESDEYFHSILYQDIVATIYQSNRFSSARIRDLKYLPSIRWSPSLFSQIIGVNPSYISHSPRSLSSSDMSTSSVSTATTVESEMLTENVGYKPEISVSSWKSVAQALCFKEAFNYRQTLRPDLSERTYIVRVQENKRLTPKSYSRNIFHIEFDISGTGLNYEIGEALGIHGQNDPTESLKFLQMYGLDGTEIVDLPSRDSQISETRTSLQIVTQHIDLFGKPQKRFYSELAGYATEEVEKSSLLLLSSSEGAKLFKHRSEVEMVTFVDVLQEFASARPPFHVLTKIIPPLKRREYSIASSQKVHPTSVHLLVVVVNWQDPLGRERFGHCTRYLSNLKVGSSVAVSIKPSVMKLPQLHTQPIIMAGLGTGLAPFRAFVEHRAWQKQQGIEIGKVFLYLGSRHQREEYLYGDEFEAYEQAGIITLLGKAFSRDQPHKVYIQDIMRSTLPEIVDAFIVESGSFYLCGPTWPVPDVTKVLEDAIILHSTMTNVKTPNTSKIIEQLKDDSRFVLEVLDRQILQDLEFGMFLDWVQARLHIYHLMTINKLDDASVRAISSGQIITNVIDIVKELVENSADAASTVVTVILEDYGMDGITVKDNGHGVPVVDRNCMAKRYYTSKLQSFEDLPSVRTYGFRGEALASIAAIAGEMTITTKTDADNVATAYFISTKGEVLSQRNVSSARGTSIVIKKLFAMLPVRRENARKQALKLPGQIRQLLTTFSIVNPLIRFSAQVKGGNRLRDITLVPTKCVIDTIAQVLGKKVPDHCIWIQSKDLADTLKIEAFLPDPSKELQPLNGKGHFIYIDNRPINCSRGNLKMITKLLNQYISNSFNEPSRLSDIFYYLNFFCPKGFYDPNVEPSKDSVLFRDFNLVIAKLEELLVSVYGALENVPEQDSTLKESNQGTKRTSRVEVALDSIHSLDEIGTTDETQCSVSSANPFDSSREEFPRPEFTTPKKQPHCSLIEQHILTNPTTPSKSSSVKTCARIPWKFSMAEEQSTSDSEESILSIIGSPETNSLKNSGETTVLLNNPWTLAKLNNIQNLSHKVEASKECLGDPSMNPVLTIPPSLKPKHFPQCVGQGQDQTHHSSKPITSFFSLADNSKVPSTQPPSNDSSKQLSSLISICSQSGLTITNQSLQSIQNVREKPVETPDEQASCQPRQKRRKISPKGKPIFLPLKGDDQSPHKNRQRNATRILGSGNDIALDDSGFATHNLETEMECNGILGQLHDYTQFAEDISATDLTGLADIKWQGKISMDGQESLNVLCGYSNDGLLRALFIVACPREAEIVSNEVVIEKLLHDNLGTMEDSSFSIDCRDFSYIRIL